jgi:choline-glycine betaine transporter
MNKSLIATVIFFILAAIIGAILFLLWQFGIFRKEPPTSSKVEAIRKQIDFINKKSSSNEAQEIFNLLQNLPATKLNIEPIKPEELNRTNLF